MPDIDAANQSRYFLPYQVRWIGDDAQLRLARKSVRIGWTYADAFKNVRKRLHHKNRDYLFATKDHATAIEYVQSCEKFADIYRVARSIVSRGEEEMKVPVFGVDGRDTGFTEDVKVGYIKFDTGSRILAFSANPNAMRAYGGDVGLDEFAFQKQAEAMWASASGRITWGYDLGVWSSCNGADTLFSTFGREAEAGKGGWSYYKVTILDAIEAGLVEKINAVSGTNLSREEFLEGCRRRARLQQVFDQEYLCIDSGGAADIVPWSVIAMCSRDYPIERVHLEAADIARTFGEFSPATEARRQVRIREYLDGHFARVFDQVRPHSLGFDVAASGQGDLACIWVDEIAGRREDRSGGDADLSGTETPVEKKWSTAQKLQALFTCRTEDWDFLQTVLLHFLQRLPACRGAGDETGLGRQICWTANQRHKNFLPVNFSNEKHNMGLALMMQLQSGEKVFPGGAGENEDIPQDIFALKKSYANKRWIFTASANPLNEASHCDMAWAGALSTHAAAQAGESMPFVRVPTKAGSVAALRRNRALAG